MQPQVGLISSCTEPCSTACQAGAGAVCRAHLVDPESHFLEMAALPLQHYFGGSFKGERSLENLTAC